MSPRCSMADVEMIERKREPVVAGGGVVVLTRGTVLVAMAPVRSAGQEDIRADDCEGIPRPPTYLCRSTLRRRGR